MHPARRVWVSLETLHDFLLASQGQQLLAPLLLLLDQRVVGSPALHHRFLEATHLG